MRASTGSIMNAKVMPPTQYRSAPLFVGSVEKAFQVLFAFRRGQREMGLRDLGLSEIAELSGLDKSAAQRFTNTLKLLGFIDQDRHTRRYRPAIRLLDLAYTYLVSDALAENAMPRLIEASRVHGTTVNLCKLSGTDILYVIRIPHEKAAYRTTLPGRRVPAFCTASGIVMLAFRPQEEVEAILAGSEMKPVTEWTITDPKEVRARIEAAHHDGFAICAQQMVAQEISTAAPILDGEGRSIGAVQIPVYMPRWTIEAVREKIVPLATETARLISGTDFAGS